MKLFKKKNQNQMEQYNPSTGETPKAPEQVNHPSHYNQYPIEVIQMMINIFGVDAVYTFCILNAFKYRMRIGHKDNVEQDLAKEKWYLDRAKELKQIIGN